MATDFPNTKKMFDIAFWFAKRSSFSGKENLNFLLAAEKATKAMVF